MGLKQLAISSKYFAGKNKPLPGTKDVHLVIGMDQGSDWRASQRFTDWGADETPASMLPRAVALLNGMTFNGYPVRAWYHGEVLLTAYVNDSAESAWGPSIWIWTSATGTNTWQTSNVLAMATSSALNLTPRLPKTFLGSLRSAKLGAV